MSRSGDVKRLQGRHLAVLDLHLEGKNNREIALALGMDPHTVGEIVRSPLAQHRISAQREAKQKNSLEAHAQAEQEALEVLRSGMVKAAEKQVSLIDSETSEAISLKACDSVLDRMLGKKQDSQPSKPVEIVIGTKETNVLQVALEESLPQVKTVESNLKPT